MGVNPLTKDILTESLNAIFDEVYASHYNNSFRRERYILEQCGKLYRVKDTTACTDESRYKTGWLPLKQAQGFLKLLKGNDEYDV